MELLHFACKIPAVQKLSDHSCCDMAVAHHTSVHHFFSYRLYYYSDEGGG